MSGKMSIREMAEILHVDDRTVRRYITDGININGKNIKINATWTGTRYEVTTADFDNFIAEWFLETPFAGYFGC